MISEFIKSEQPSPVVEAENLHFSYKSDPWVVRNATLSAKRGEFWGIIGPNGAGKTTLLRLLIGSLKPKRGSVRLQGMLLSHLTRQSIARQVAFVPQKTVAAFPFTVFEMVLMGRQPYAGLSIFEDASDLATAEQALARVGISSLKEKIFQELSGGEQQLVVLARAIAQDTPLLVLDEPVSYLDLRHQYEILSLLGGLVSEGRTVLATFHDLNAAARWCTHIALMVEGQIVKQGPPPEVLCEELLRQAYRIPLRVVHRASGFPGVELP